jgi:hypothetical protein
VSDKPARIAALKAEIAERQAELLRLAREYAAELAGLRGDERLQFISGDGTNVPTNMEAQIATKSRAAKISASKAGRLKTSLPWQRALQLEGITAQEWAARQKAPPLGGEKARSWMKKPGRGGHAIPRFWAERIAKEYPDVPAVDASWPSGIRD